MKDIFEDYLWLPELVIPIHHIHSHTHLSIYYSFFFLDFPQLGGIISAPHGGTAIFLITVQRTQLASGLLSLHRGTPVRELHRSQHAHRAPSHPHHIRGGILGSQGAVLHPQAQPKMGGRPLFPRGSAGGTGILRLPIRGVPLLGENTHTAVWPPQHPIPWRPAPLWPGTQWFLRAGSRGGLLPRGEWLHRHKRARSGEGLGGSQVATGDYQGGSSLAGRHGKERGGVPGGKYW